MSEPAIFVIRAHRGGWQCFEAPGVEPYYTGTNGQEQAISYALNCRTAHRYGEIRVMNAAGEIERTIPFDGRTRGGSLSGRGANPQSRDQHAN